MTRSCRLTLVGALCACVAAPASAQEPVRVGVLTIRSGPIASCGRQMEDGFQFALKERSGAVAGRKVDVFFGDSAGQPAQTRTKTLELVERNRVHVLTGPIAAFEVYAISDYIRQAEIPIIISPAAADDITQRRANPWFVRATMSGSQVTHPLGEYAARKLGYKRIATVSDDFAYGHEHTAGFQRTFEENGGIRVDPYGNPIVNVYIRRVEGRDGRLMNVVIDTYRDVSQFWKYDPLAFLAAPVYSRDYPPAKHIE